MMDKGVFEKSISALLYFKGVKVDQHHTDFLYNLMKNDFENEEFKAMCGDICKSEDLFNKYPDPKLFYDRKKSAQKTILVEEGSFFLDDTMPEYKPYLEGVSYEQQDLIGNWILKHKRGEMVSQDWVIEIIKKFCPKHDEIEQIEPSIAKKLIGVIKKV